MADSGGIRWAWSIAGRPTAAELATAAAAYAARFGRWPSLVFVHPDHLVDGIAPPLGVQVEADPLMGRGLVAFAVAVEVAAVEVQP